MLRLTALYPLMAPVEPSGPGGIADGEPVRTGGAEPEFYADEDVAEPAVFVDGPDKKEETEPPPKKRGRPKKEEPAPEHEEEPGDDTGGGDDDYAEPEGEPEQKPEAAETEGFKDDFAYTVKGQRRTLPDWAQSAVKDEASSKAVKEIFEKAEGFDYVKNDRDSLQNWYNEVQPTLQNVQMLNQLLEQKQYAAFFQGVGLPLQEVLNFSLSYAQMDPSARANLLSQSQQVFTQHQQQLQTQNTLSQYQQDLVTAREREVNLLLSRPDVVQASQQIDQRLGRIGVLRDEIINRGKFYAAQGRDVPAETLLNEVLSISGVPLGGQPTAPAAIPTNGGGGQPLPAGAGQAPRNQGTMTNLRGSGRSPARKVIKSRKDLLERAKQLEAQGR